MGREKQYWLLKTEPGEWSWEDQAANGGLSKWDGVKNKQAQKNLKSMRIGDLCFFYHSGSKARRVVGVVSVVREWYVDDKDEDGAVDVRAAGEMRRPVDLKEMKGDGGLKGLALFKQPRLSVVPVPEDMWNRICEMGAKRPMQALVLGPRFAVLLNRSRWKASSFRALSSYSDYFNQSRGCLPRFFSEVLPPSKGGVVHIQGDEFWHMTKVLRLSTSDRVELFNGKGGLIEGCIQRIDRTGLDVVALEEPKLVLPQTTQWHVFAAFGTLKGGRADWLVEKCTELGANTAAKQCQRLHEMTLNPPTKIGDLLPIVAQSKLSFVAVAEATPVISALSSSHKESSGLLIIGPEGDFTVKEINLIMEVGATAVAAVQFLIVFTGWVEVFSWLAVSKAGWVEVLS
ncbi:hypothetical protein F0562_020799 [Nyssa sinensis]|uniref:16S rRNA (uracil(1498)-N(3))-methyltransferase n=1 Tax=Nyssa sinensis TaxID=561372 RepID=A0A5J5BUJ0_9ASTE|nr:hypothetical protein F0562_020799 [Nyssa sinensis]